jgi:hypothetical protein
MHLKLIALSMFSLLIAPIVSLLPQLEGLYIGKHSLTQIPSRSEVHQAQPIHPPPLVTTLLVPGGKPFPR